MEEKTVVTGNNSVAEERKPKKKSKKIWIALIGVVLALFVGVVILLAAGIAAILLWPKSVYSNEYALADDGGIETIGTAGEFFRKKAHAEMFDPFENLIVTFGGISPEGIVFMELKDYTGVYENVDYDVSDKTFLSNGDVITITFGADIDPVAYCVENYGMCPSVTSKEYTVEGLMTVIDSLSQITSEAENEMIEGGRKEFMWYVMREWSDGYTVDSFTLVGYYFLKPKEGMEEYGRRFYMVYRVNATWKYTDPLWREQVAMQPVEYYYLIECPTPYIDQDGNCVADVKYPYVSYHEIGFTVRKESISGGEKEQTMTTLGYLTLEDIFATVETEPHRYIYETNIPKQ